MRRLVVSLSVLVVLGAGAVWRFTHVVSAEAYTGGREPYVAFDTQSIHRRGCLDPTARERALDVDIVRLRVEKETSLVLTLRGNDALQPGVVITADDGEAADDGWMREIASRDGRSLVASVVLPVAGAYTFIIVDKRELVGDEMSSGKGCFSVDMEPAAPPTLQQLPLVWRGTIGAPIAFAVHRGNHLFTLVEVSNVGGNGVALLSVFEDGRYARSVTIAPKQHAEIVIDTRDGSARLLLQEASSLADLPVVVSLRPVGYPQKKTPVDGASSNNVTAISLQ